MKKTLYATTLALIMASTNAFAGSKCITSNSNSDFTRNQTQISDGPCKKEDNDSSAAIAALVVLVGGALLISHLMKNNKNKYVGQSTTFKADPVKQSIFAGWSKRF